MNNNSSPTPTAIQWKFFNASQLSDDDKAVFSSSLLLASQTLACSFFNKYKNLIGINIINIIMITNNIIMVALPELLGPLVDILRLIRPQGSLVLIQY